MYESVRKRPRLDIDRDSAMGLSVFTGGTNTTYSEASLLDLNYVFQICIDVATLFFLVHVGSTGQGAGGA